MRPARSDPTRVNLGNNATNEARSTYIGQRGRPVNGLTVVFNKNGAENIRVAYLKKRPYWGLVTNRGEQKKGMSLRARHRKYAGRIPSQHGSRRFAFRRLISLRRESMRRGEAVPYIRGVHIGTC